jgi:hypothetical protein
MNVKLYLNIQSAPRGRHPPYRFLLLHRACCYNHCFIATHAHTDLVIEFYDQISPGQELQTHIQTDGNDIRPYTAQTHNERTSTESNLVTAQNTAHEPPEDGRTYRPKHVGATSKKCF